MPFILGTFGNFLNAQIDLTSFTPVSGPVGTSVTLTGNNFNTTSSNNIVYFGPTRGTISASTSTSITVTVPAGANFQNLSVTDQTAHMTTYSSTPFGLTYACGGVIDLSSFDQKTDFSTGTSPGSISLGDLDGDGKPDLVVANNADNTVSILKNASTISNMSFDFRINGATGSGPQGVAVGDINGDGLLDVVVTSSGSNIVSVSRNTRVGIAISYAPKLDYATGSSPRGVTVADIDLDGRPDIIVTNASSNTISIFRNIGISGGVAFAPKIDFPVGASPRSVTVGDIDGDLKPDIIITNYASSTVSVLRNTSTIGTISFLQKVDFTTGSSPMSLAIGDLDGDGKPDIAVANNGSNTISVFPNTSGSGNVSFGPKTDISTGLSPANVSIGDIDGDGRPDLAVTNKTSNTVSVIKNTSTSGNISLATKVDFPTGTTPDGVVIGDLDGDGKSDIAVSNTFSNTASIIKDDIYAGPTLTCASSISVCSGDVANIHLTSSPASTYTWQANDNLNINGESNSLQSSGDIIDTLTNLTSSPQTVSYVVNPTSIAGLCLGAPQTITVTVNPRPGANAGTDTSLTCTTNLISLTGTSNTSPVTYQWMSPDSGINNTQSISAATSGMYLLTVSNSVTFCISIDTMIVSYDTASPIFTCPLTYQITNCVPGTITINGSTNNPLDSIHWQGPGIPATNPAFITNPNNYTLIAKNNSNGCIGSRVVTVTNTAIHPSIISPAPVAFNSILNMPILDSITCANASISLNFSGTSVNSLIKIIRPAPISDTVANHSYATLPGIYKALITDTLNGCNGSAFMFELQINVTAPQIIMPASLPPLNCSAISAVLDGSSGTPNSILKWTGPTIFSVTDPATVTQPGDYVLTVTNPVNGCTSKDTLTLVHQNTLFVNGSADTTICKGSAVTLHASPVGGMPLFLYSWNNGAGNSSSATVSPVDTIQYIATITDAAGCTGKDTVTVNIPSAITDSTRTFHLCDPDVADGQIQIFASEGVPPYLYSINNGQNFQSSQIFLNLSFGTYPIVITDALNCSHSDVAIVNSTSQKPVPDFIVNTNMMQADTFVVVDISNPRPDTVFWNFPSTVTVVDNNPFAPVIVSSDTGAVSIGMETRFGSCTMSLTKTVHFIKADTLAASPNGNGIDSIMVYPNPNTGQFYVKVELYKQQTFAIYIYNSQGTEQQRIAVPESLHNTSSIILPNPVPGTYLVKVIAEYDSKSKTVVITQ